MLAASGRQLRLEEAQCPAAAALPFRDGGVYLLTGGAGGLGLLFAEAIAREARDATLILTGRSALSEGARARLEALPARWITARSMFATLLDWNGWWLRLWAAMAASTG